MTTKEHYKGPQRIENYEKTAIFTTILCKIALLGFCFFLFWLFFIVSPISYAGAHSNFSLLVLRHRSVSPWSMTITHYPVSVQQRNLALMRWLWYVSSIEIFDNANQWVVSTKQAQNKHWSERVQESWQALEYKAQLISIGGNFLQPSL